MTSRVAVAWSRHDFNLSSNRNRMLLRLPTEWLDSVQTLEAHGFHDRSIPSALWTQTRSYFVSQKPVVSSCSRLIRSISITFFEVSLGRFRLLVNPLPFHSYTSVMKVSSTLLVAIGLVADQVQATWNVRAQAFDCPSNTNNICSDAQSSGFDWNDLQTGSFSQYQGFDFSGFTCANSFGKRDALSKRAFNSKCIQGTAEWESGPSISRGQGQQGFSITQMHISTSRDSDLEFVFGMEDGSTCRQTSPCNSGGSIISNTQCGGATQVIVKVPKHEKEGCDVGIHSVIFDCNTSQNTTPPSQSSPSSSATDSSSLPVTTLVEGRPTGSKPPSLSSPVPSYPLSNATTPSSTPGSPTEPTLSSSVPMTTSTIFSTQTFTITSCSEAVTDCPAGSTVLTTSAVAVSTTICPVSEVPTSPPPPSGAPGDAVPSSSTLAESTPSESLPAVPSDTPPAVPPQCPDVLPKCMNTWMFKSGCNDNTDFDCYCKNPEFTKYVIDCVNSWGVDETIIAKALTFLQGICAAQIPENPGIVTDCPTYISTEPTPVPSSPAPSAFTPEPSAQSSTPGSPEVPSQPTESDVIATEIVSTTLTTCPAGQTVTSGTITRVLETPSVSTILITTTSTICTKCTGRPTSPDVSPSTTPGAPIVPPVPSPPGPVPQTPMTTIYISTTVTVPCSTNGTPIPSSSTTSLLTTVVTVPAIQFTIGSSSSINLVPVTTPPAAGPAQPNPGRPVQSTVAGSLPTASTIVPPVLQTTLGTLVTAPRRTTTGALPVFTGGAEMKTGKILGVMAGGAVAALVF
ncbi:hypothetical protein P152DRAFT_513823 [Eremomyces bilateralis CBS 781.70]|uniref:CFEM domain-containing protein n=1 Tax=Eremomyces bilateralis CBS 781.70 TaxID=1392243 RepID=A0A6G1G4E1_9PEZI|nr:uncharacterized protein P152DRAFT_513823 [Eremomyces bilateralis CBS 781.70]KAF1812780.1 hypothetical protein P152DRAFT_513823 [Eremomyces bilateralis CBS 781.70]